jgi:alcohol dehydrogenase class IV
VQNFVFSLPTRVTFGPGSIEAVGQETATIGSRGMVVTGNTFVRRSGLINQLCSSLQRSGVSVSVYDEAGPNTTVEVIDRGGRLARDEGVDFVLGLGGGSAMDAAKAIAVSALSDASIWEYTHHQIDEPAAVIDRALPIAQIPIVASTGSETSATAMVYEPLSRIKAPITSPHLLAKVAIVDPTLTFSVPPRYTAVGGMNIVSQMLESYLTSDEFPVTDRITEGLVRVVMDSLPRAMRRGEDLDARNNLSWAATLASSLGMAGRGASMPVRSMAHPLAAHFTIDHGMAVAALWPSFMRYALANRYRLPQVGRFKRYALLGRQLFGVHETDDEVAAETTAFRFTSWLRGMDMPSNLAALGVEGFDVAELADQAVTVSGNGKRLPGGLSVEDIEHIYESALRPS